MTPYLTCPDLAAIPSVKHGFFTQHIAESSHDYSLLPNRSHAMQYFGSRGEDLCIVTQKHTNNVITVSRNLAIADAPIADAMVTNIPGLVLGILTADCTPVLYVDAQAGVIGAAHAGWKGARTGVIENTLEAMSKLGASLAHITAAIGPCIQQSSYEVGPEFYENFLQDSEKNAQFFIPSIKPTHFMFDMPGFVTRKLMLAGVEKITNIHRDTCSDEENFFSYRRCCLQGTRYFKNGLSAITLI